MSRIKKENRNLTPAQKKKRILLTAIIYILAVLILLVVVYFVSKSISENMDKTLSVKQVDETYQSFNFYPVSDKENWDSIDIFSDPEYAVKDCNPSFTSMSLGGTVLIKDIPDTMKNEAHRFFEAYFDMLKSGNYKLYPLMFSEKYKNNMTGFEDNINREFPPQMVYDIKIIEQARIPSTVINGKECVIGLYEVSYLIHKNDGLFRNDIGKDIDLGKDMARPLFFELITYDAGTQNEKTYINNLYTASSIKSQNEKAN